MFTWEPDALQHLLILDAFILELGAFLFLDFLDLAVPNLTTPD